MRKLGAAVVASVIAGMTSLSAAPAGAQTSPPANAAKPAPPPPTEARAKAVAASTVKQISERSRKGFDLPFVLCKDIDADLPAWRVAAGKGDLNGQIVLGLCNYYGIGGKQNRDRGVELIKTAADKGHHDAMAVLGILLRNGDLDHPPQIGEATKYLQRAADEGNPLGRDQLAIFRFEALRMSGQFDQAMALLEGAAADGSLNAIFHLGMAKLDGWITGLDEKAGIAHLQAAAKAGHVRATYELGRAYLTGTYVAPNPNYGTQLIDAAASMGYMQAIHMISGTNESGATQQNAPSPKQRAYFRQIETSPDPMASLMLHFRYSNRVRDTDAGFDERVSDRAMDAARRGVVEAYPYASRIYRNGTPKYPKDLARARAILEAGVAAMDPESMLELAMAARHGWFEPANEDAALKHFEAAAAAGVAPAMTIVGEAFREGRGLPRDPAKAYRAYLSGAFAGEAEAMYAVARALTYGEAVEQNAQKAEFWAKSAIRRGNADGYHVLFEIVRLGLGKKLTLEETMPLLLEGGKAGSVQCTMALAAMMIEGRLIPADVAGGVDLLEKLLARDKDGKVRIALARYYHGGSAVPVNLPRSFELLQQAADLGNAEAWYLLGHARATGDGQEKNWGEAVDCYSKAIRLGYDDAMLVLGSHYLEGRVTERDPARTVELWTDAADRGNGFAAFTLARLYFGVFDPSLADETNALKWARTSIEREYTAICSIAFRFYAARQDFASARQWAQRGVELKNAESCNDLGMLYRGGGGVEQNMDEAFKLFTQGREAGSLAAAANLAWFYETGTAVEKDLAESLRLATLAAEGGETTGMLALGRLYVDGIGTEKDVKKGLEWIQRAADAGNELAKNMIAAAREKGIVP